MTTVEISYNGVDLVCEGDYYPPEKRQMYDSNLSGYPGTGADFDVHKITVSDSMVDIIDLC